jgi:hypothetical protein
MKQIFILLAVAGTITACKQKKQAVIEPTMVLSATDSTELKEFREWKAQQANIPAVKNTPAKTVVYNTNNNTTAAPAATTTKTKKKGWSKAAKGAAIGAGTGAVAGAIINKRNRAAGAAVGVIIGGGAGYGIGRAMDKKDGRY